MGRFDVVDDIASGQHGLITTAQLGEAGFSRDAVLNLRKGHRLEPVRRRVYRLAGAPRTWEQAVLGAVLSAGGEVCASHRTAIAVWQLGDRPVEAVHIAVPAVRNIRLPGVTCHRTTRWDEGVVTVHSGIPVSRVERALLDISGLAGERALGRLIDEALRRQMTTIGRLRSVRAPFGPGRTRRLAIFDRVIDRRRALPASGASQPERDLARSIVRAGLPAPQQNVRIRLGRATYELDLAYVDLKIAVEYDGWSTHGQRSDFEHDRAKDRALTTAGWVCLRVTSADDHSQVVNQLAVVITQRSAA